MEKRITERYSESILKEALERYSIPPENVSPLGGFESYIYAFSRDDEESILRISHSLRRKADLIRGELDWVNSLYNDGVGVSRPIKSDLGDWVETIDDSAGGYFVASVFEKALGEPFRGPDWPEELLWEYGNQIGKMHRNSTTYSPPELAWKRPEWDDPVNIEVDQFIPAKDQKIKDIYQQIVEVTRNLPKDESAYGLIHQDAHRGNFFVNEDGKITIFDFDDSSYSWFVEDIALVLFYAVMRQEDPQQFTENFLNGFLPGYFAAYPLDIKWLEYIPLFMKRRELDLYAVIHRSFDVENIENAWVAYYMRGRKQRIEEGIPFIDFSFEELGGA
jgi:Ser/Thr protein kinase RdoA (MazF antagonist)